jgi:hypothetical protein
MNCLKKLDSNTWEVISGNASYKWFGSLSSIFLKQVFSRRGSGSEQLDDARRVYRQFEVFYFASAAIMMVVLNLALRAASKSTP